jgi:hypothetical protein
MHHRNAERVLWTYDIHLLAARLSRADWHQFTELALRKQVAGVCRHQLEKSREGFGTMFPDAVARRLDAASPEAASDYLRPGRSWLDEVFSNIRSLPGWRHRAHLLRAIVFPSRRYMRGAYGVRGRLFGTAVLPALYVHRGVSGAWRVVTGRK